MENNTTQTVAQDEPVKKMKLSEIISAIQNSEVEADISGIIVTADVQGGGTLCSVLDDADSYKRNALDMLAKGMTHLVALIMTKQDARAWAILGELYGKRIVFEDRIQEMESKLGADLGETIAEALRERLESAEQREEIID